jgi:hypothetical protein
MASARRAVAAVLVVAVLALAACADDDDDDDGAAGPTTTTAPVTSTTAAAPTTTATATTAAAGAPSTTRPAVAPTLRLAPLAKGASDLDYDVTGSYPQLDGLTGPAATAVNPALAARATGVITAFERDLRDFGEVATAGADLRSFVEVAPEATLLTPDLASVRLDVLTYVAGAAHPAAGFTTVTFDLRTGRPLVLADLFTPGAPYLATVAERATELVTEQLDDGSGQPIELFPEGVAPTEANYAAWWLAADGLGIGFAQCQAYACAVGNLTATIPWAELRSLLAPSGPAASLAR